MFERITYMGNDFCRIVFNNNGGPLANLINMHIVIEDMEKSILCEITYFDGTVVEARYVGELVGNQLVSGTVRKPNVNSRVRFVESHEISSFLGSEGEGYLQLGYSPLYNKYPIFLSVNQFFSNHFAIFGNTGSGKSCGVSRMFQNMFKDARLKPVYSNIFLFDSSGEYSQALSSINSYNSNFNYRFISTSKSNKTEETFRIPIYLFNRDDLALLLQCTSHTQLPIIENMIRLATIFSLDEKTSYDYKNYLIAKAIMTILYTNESAANKRNEIFSLLDSCSTSAFHLDATVEGVGYTRKFRECFLIDNSGEFTESVLLTEYVSSFIKDEYANFKVKEKEIFYNLDTLEKALNFTLISEGWLRNSETYADAVTIKVRLHSLITSDDARYFSIGSYLSMENYINCFLYEDDKKCQIININYSDIDDGLAKVLTKVLSRFIFEYVKALKDRGSMPFHLILEEAHRYIQDDNDRFLFGYNIFERIAKEGRKYGALLGLISQRPGEISDTVVSQCSNFLMYKLNHPADIRYLREMVPFITDDIVNKQKDLQPGNCLGFGSAFKIPLLIRMEMPNPSPLSENCNITDLWSGADKEATLAIATEAAQAPAPAPVKSDTPKFHRELIPDLSAITANISEPVRESRRDEVEPVKELETIPYANLDPDSDVSHRPLSSAALRASQSEASYQISSINNILRNSLERINRK